MSTEAEPAFDDAEPPFDEAGPDFDETDPPFELGGRSGGGRSRGATQASPPPGGRLACTTHACSSSCLVRCPVRPAPAGWSSRAAAVTAHCSHRRLPLPWLQSGGAASVAPSAIPKKRGRRWINPAVDINLIKVGGGQITQNLRCAVGSREARTGRMGCAYINADTTRLCALPQLHTAGSCRLWVHMMGHAWASATGQRRQVCTPPWQGLHPSAVHMAGLPKKGTAGSPTFYPIPQEDRLSCNTYNLAHVHTNTLPMHPCMTTPHPAVLQDAEERRRERTRARNRANAAASRCGCICAGHARSAAQRSTA